MRHSTAQRQNHLQAISIILLVLGLWGCSGTPEQKSPEPPTPPPVVEQAPKPAVSLTLPHSAFSAQFSSAEQSLARFDWMAASVTLQAIPPRQLSADDRTYLGYLEARIAYARGHQAQALAQLEQLTHPAMNAALQYRILNFRRYIVEMSGDNLQSAQLADQILRWAPAASAAALKRGIWRDLQRVDTRQLQNAGSAATDPQWRGWLELALLSRDSGNSQISNNLSDWRSTNPDHPAATPLPGGLDYVLQRSPPLDKVALLLPLSGRLAPAGRAVLDGYLANYYAARAAGQGNFEVLVLDTDSYESANTAYNEALKQGAKLVVGPLSKQAVAELGTRLERPIPVLALNRTDQVLPATGSALVQLSLAPEDEAERIAELAFGQGARAALIVRPAGDWGNKVQQALQTRWTALGGTVADSVSYANRDDYSNSVKGALDIPASEKRSHDVRSMLATNIEFTVRRRQDLDVIFLLSRDGAEARSIKPLLAFHYAGNLPIYATSSIYSNVRDARDRDLNGINLVETPWLLDYNPDLQKAIATGNTGSDNYTRLNALGADAFLLQSGFRRLQAGPDWLLRGNTGLLSMDPQLRIHRELSLATFDGGILKSQ